MTEKDLKRLLDLPESKNLSPEDQKLEDCLRECHRKMLEEKARLGLDVVTADEHGVPRSQRAIDVYHRVFGELPPLY